MGCAGWRLLLLAGRVCLQVLSSRKCQVLSLCQALFSAHGLCCLKKKKKRQTHPLVSYLLLGRCSGNFSRLLEGGGAEEEQKHGRASGGLRLAVRPAGQACPVEKVTFVPGREGDGGVLQAGVGGQQDRQRVSVRGRVARAEGVEGWQRFSG